MNLSRLISLLLCAAFFQQAPAATVESDICIYGGTSGGVAAAVAAARLGKTVTLLTQNNHVGGMTASGLGVTDIGVGNDPSYIGGISREFYRRVGAAYGSTNLVIWFEPKVAETVFWQMLTEANVLVYSNQLLASAAVVSNRITQITTLDGTVFRAKQFIDTSYEGDLMAAAGVTFTVGREANTTYGESLAGVRPLGGSFVYDPYVVPGDSNSGLLPFVQSGTNPPAGSADHRLQAFNFRLCLTQNATNKIPITAPTNYLESNYELFRRYLAARVASNGAVQLNELIHIQQIIPKGKTDINANGELSTDYVGASYTWATNTHAGREAIRAEHENYIRGMLYFYATSTNVPLNVRTQAQSWGLAADEFTDTGGWPWQIYVREARRMVSDYVMIEQNATGVRLAPEPICLGRYTIDSHGVQRLASGTATRWEGSIGGSVPFPYPISYRSIIPRTGECENVYTTFALSASHVGFSSCRMEPVFMMTSQAAATAAAFAIDDQVPSQQVNYPKLAAQLRADGQLLAWSTGSASTNGIIIDQSDTNAFAIGAWTFGANAGGWNTNYLHDQSTGKGTKSVRYVPTITNAGPYEIYLWWVESSNRPTNTPVDIVHNAGTTRILVNQRLSSGGWSKILTTNFNVGTNGSVIIRNDGTAAGTFVVADGVKFVPVGSAAPPTGPPLVEIVASDAVAEEFGTNRARFALVRSGGDTNLPALTVNYSVTGSATSGSDFLTLPGSITFSAGAQATNILMTPLVDTLVEGDETVTLNLLSSANYTLGALSNATVVLRDRPVDTWRKTIFTPSELLDANISGDLANPDGDGAPNLVEYALGLNPRAPDSTLFAPRIEAGHFTLTYTRAKAATDVTVTLQHSTNLTTWQSTPALFEEMSRVDLGASESITVRLSATASGAPGFVRLVVNRN